MDRKRKMELSGSKEETRSYESMTTQEKWNILAMVANLYYNGDMTQNEIADRMYTSRSKISRMLKEARELGIVEISIKEPWERDQELEAKIQEKFGISTVRVVSAREGSRDQMISRLSAVTAYYLDSVIRENMVVGISWGNTLYQIVKYINANNRKNIPVTVVPMMGASNLKRPEQDAMNLAKELASAYGGTYQYIYAPLFVKNKEIKESLIQDDTIQTALHLAQTADMILTSAGSIEYKTWENYLGESTFQFLGNKGAVGHIGGHFYNLAGEEIITELSDRMIGIGYEDLKRCPNVVCVACGDSKAKAIVGALHGGLIRTLIIDSECGEKVLEIS